MKVLKTILFLIWLMTSSASSLSVQGEDESSKLSNIFAEDMGASSASSSLTEMQLQRNKNRELRLLFLGALTEQLVKWFFNDILPSEVMHRTKRSLNIPGKNMNFLKFKKILDLHYYFRRARRLHLFARWCSYSFGSCPGSRGLSKSRSVQHLFGYQEYGSSHPGCHCCCRPLCAT